MGAPFFSICMSPCEARLVKFVNEGLGFQIPQDLAGKTYSVTRCCPVTGVHDGLLLLREPCRGDLNSRPHVVPYKASSLTPFLYGSCVLGV